MSNTIDEPPDGDGMDADFPRLLERAVAGDFQDAETILPAVYDELRRIASSLMRSERKGHTLQTTALLHEAYVSLQNGSGAELRFANSQHFLAVAARAMRRILINHATAKKTKKRTAPDLSLRCATVVDCFDQRCIDLLVLDEALHDLAELDANQAKIVELRFFAGMSVRACAEVLKISERTVHYEWSHARAWLRRRLEGES